MAQVVSKVLTMVNGIDCLEIPRKSQNPTAGGFARGFSFSKLCSEFFRHVTLDMPDNVTYHLTNGN